MFLAGMRLAATRFFFESYSPRLWASYGAPPNLLFRGNGIDCD